ncbi:MAG: chorismate lyase, partial [Methylococcaceae bacterium]|nr:chorismate lyase [Methylococcaceae bacterium]
MHLRSLLFQREPAWQAERLIVAPFAIRPWLFETGSLTTRLRRLAGPGVGVHLLGQGRNKPFAGEYASLELPVGRRALVREVVLHCEGRPLVLARTVIPPRTLRGRHRGLAHLGERPLGEVLFALRGLQRQSLELARIEPAGWRPSIAGEYGITESV